MTHGQRATYVQGCRCGACRQANSDYARARDRRAAYAKYDPSLAPLVDSGPVRAHLRELRAAGMGRRTIATRAGVAQTVVSRLLEVDRSRPAGKIRPTTAARLLAVRADTLAPSALVDGIGTRRRLRALVALGYTQHDLAQRIGWTDANIGTLIFDRGKVTQRTHDLVADLFTRLELTPGPCERARRRATRRGWEPPFAWDHDSIDDPQAEPDLGTTEAQAWEQILEDYLDTWDAHGGILAAAAQRMRISERHLVRSLGKARESGHDVTWTYARTA